MAKRRSTTNKCKARKEISRKLRRRRGSTLVYVAVTAPVLIGFCSLAVDLGRVELAKTELEAVANAAARAAAKGFATSVAQAKTNAANVCAANTVDDAPLTLDTTNDIQFINWNSSSKTYTVLTGSAQSSANAILVTPQCSKARGTAIPLLFAGAIGVHTCDIHASSIATVSTNSSYGVVGINSVTVSGAASINSYDASSSGQYSGANSSSNAQVESNGTIALTGSSIIYGNANPGPSGTVTIGGASSVTGTTTKLSNPISYPAPTAPCGASDLCAINLSGIATQTLTAGTYTCNTLSIANSAALTVTGAVTIYCSGGVSLSGAVHVTGNLPGNFIINVTGSSPVNLGNSAALNAVIYAPTSSVSVTGAGGLCGAVVAKNLTVSNSGVIHYDISSPGGTGSTSTITLVR